MRAASENERLAYTVNEAAAIAGVNRRTLYKERQAGKLQMLTVQGRTMIRADELRRWVNSWAVHETTGQAGRSRKETVQPKPQQAPTREQIRAQDSTDFLNQLEAARARQATQQPEQEPSEADHLPDLVTRLRQRHAASSDPGPDKVDGNSGDLWARLRRRK